MTSPAELANLLIERIAVDDIELLRTESIDAIEVLYDIPVTLVERGAIPGGCGVEGRYFSNPPRIQVAMSYAQRRRAFTALHELAHHLVGLVDNADIAITLAKFPQFGKRAEESVADEFAARILIPEALCTKHIASRGPTAANVATLYDESSGSLRACLLRAAGFQRDDGYIVMARDGVVEYAQPTADAFDTGSGGRHPHNHLLQLAERKRFRHQVTGATHRKERRRITRVPRRRDQPPRLRTRSAHLCSTTHVGTDTSGGSTSTQSGSTSTARTADAPRGASVCAPPARERSAQTRMNTALAAATGANAGPLQHCCDDSAPAAVTRSTSRSSNPAATPAPTVGDTRRVGQPPTFGV